MPGDFDRSPSPGEREAGACPQAWGKKERDSVAAGTKDWP